MKRIITAIIIMTLLICISGCTEEYGAQSDTNTQIVILPSEHIKDTVNGYKAEIYNDITSDPSTDIVSSSSESSSTLPESNYYVGNKNSKKFHNQYCKYVSSISDKNLHVFDSVEDAINDGYSPCGTCMKNH